MADLAESVGVLPGVRAVVLEMDELVAHAERDALLPLMRTLRDDPRFAFEQVMDICGVDWPERAERFDVVYNLLSVSLKDIGWFGFLSMVGFLAVLTVGFIYEWCKGALDWE